MDVFRLRNGVLSRIESSDINASRTKSDGTFDLQTKDTSGIVLSQSGKTIATIDERTGKISLEDTSFQIKVTGATKDAPMQIQVLSGTNQIIYSEKINISSASRIESVANLDGITGTGVFIAPNSGFSFARNTTTSPNLPDGGYITNASHQAIAGISAGGDIYLLDSKYRLSYATKDSYILIRLKDSTDNTVANFLYRIGAEYVIK